MWRDIAQAMAGEFADLGDPALVTSWAIRLLAAAILGGVVGFEREVHHKSAGLRTHMLVAAGAALFIMAPPRALLSGAEMGRIIQGIAAGVGFIGAGAILKQGPQEHVKGLTTAAGIWLTAAVGVTAGAGHISLAILATLLGMLVLLALGWYERRVHPAENAEHLADERQGEADTLRLPTVSPPDRLG